MKPELGFILSRIESHGKDAYTQESAGQGGSSFLITRDQIHRSLHRHRFYLPLPSRFAHTHDGDHGSAKCRGKAVRVLTPCIGHLELTGFMVTRLIHGACRGAYVEAGTVATTT